MTIYLKNTTSSGISAALVKERHNIATASGMVLTLVVAVEQRNFAGVFEATQIAAREHPSRLILVVRTNAKKDNVDADIYLRDVPGEVIVVRLSGAVRDHADSVVLPLLLPDSPVIMWWPAKSPVDPARDQLGALADRRITDASGDPNPCEALLVRAEHHEPGDTDLTWTRLTPWRALLAAAVDQFPQRITGAVVTAPITNAPADLMAAWLETRLRHEVVRKRSSGPGITSVTLTTDAGDINVTREDGVTASLSIPGQPRRTVALKRRDINELLTEELRRMDADDIFEEAAKTLLKRDRRTPKDAS